LSWGWYPIYSIHSYLITTSVAFCFHIPTSGEAHDGNLIA
jgi:hypothetical protein